MYAFELTDDSTFELANNAALCATFRVPHVSAHRDAIETAISSPFFATCCVTNWHSVEQTIDSTICKALWYTNKIAIVTADSAALEAALEAALLAANVSTLEAADS